MARHLLDRLLLTLPALWLVLTMVFLLIHIVPGDPVEQMLGEGANLSQIVELRHSLGLDQPLLTQYGHYLGQILRGDLGQSLKFQAPVRRVIFERYPATLQLAFLALLVCAALAIPAGVWGAYRRGSHVDRAVLKARELEFVLAAKSLGASPLRILARHLLPNILQPVLIQATIGMAGAILAEATLSFLGLGVLAPLPSLGAMLNDARNHLFDAPHMVVFPALAVLLAVLAFNLLGDAWRDWLDPRTRAQMTALDQSR